MKNTHKRYSSGRAGHCPVLIALSFALFAPLVDAQTRQPPNPPMKGGAPPTPQRRETPAARRDDPQPVVPAHRNTVTTDRGPAREHRHFLPQRDATPNRQPGNINAGRNPGSIDAGRRPGNVRVDQRPGRTTVQRPAPVTPRSQSQARSLFSRTQEGRRYDSGLLLRRGRPINQVWLRPYFPRGGYHYPYYSPTYSASAVISPYGFYFGICAPFVIRTYSHHFPPVVVYIDIPVYSGSVCRGYEPQRREDPVLSWREVLDREPGLANAIDDLRDTFRRGDIDALAALVDPKIKIAVFLRGSYEYSLDVNDFVDLTRDALQSTDTIAFDLSRIHERSAGVYVVSGEHVYRDRDGHRRKVYVSYVLEDIRGEWTLTQVGTAPDRIQEWR